jgi:hypothetical protein
MLTAVTLFYTGLISCLNIIASGGGSNLFPPEAFADMSQVEIDERIKGSKIVIVSEQVRTKHCDTSNHGTDFHAVHAERHLDAQSMYALHVRSHDLGYYIQQMDQNRRGMGHTWLDLCSNCLLYCLPTVYWLLGRPSTQPAVHNTGALRHHSSSFQHQQRLSHHHPSYTYDMVPVAATEAKDRAFHTLQHGRIRRTSPQSMPVAPADTTPF